METWVKDILEQYGSVGVGILMLVENIFPPIPSEVVMPWAGYAVQRGHISMLGAISLGSLGSFLGAIFWYYIAKRLGRERLDRFVDRYGGWLTLSRSDVERVDAWFEQWGSIAVLVCRLIPGLRTLISIPAGLAEMHPTKFAVFTAIGTVLWTSLLAGLGYWLAGNYQELVRPLSWISTAVVLIMLGWWIWRLLQQSLARRAAQR